MNQQDDLTAFKVIIRVVKSISGQDSYHSGFGAVDIARIPLVYAKTAKDVDAVILEKYPQFFPTGKVCRRESKDTAQFFYALVYPLYDHELMEIKDGAWTCDGCGQVHENTYVARPRYYSSFSKDLRFCRGENENNDYCLNLYKKTHLSESQLSDDMNYVRADSPTYIYKITEKLTGKCYIGKTRNEPFFRWWNHLKHSQSPFGRYLSESKLSDWTFEVLEIVDWNVPDTEVFKIESTYILEHNSIENGFNSLISSKQAKNLELSL